MSVQTSTQASVWPDRFRVLSIGGRTIRYDRRVAAVGLILAVVLLVAATWSMTVGDTDLSLRQVAGAIFGQGSEADQRIVVDWRMPRMLLGLLGGAALGVSGAIFQSMTRNPLGSPDIMGFSAGAYTGALIATVVIAGTSSLSATVGALVGGILTALAVYLLAYQKGVQGLRLIVVGIAVSAMLTAFNSYLLITVGQEQAVSAAAWGAGSLNDATWNGVWVMLLSFVILVPFTVLNVRKLQMLEMGDDMAIALGVDANRTRLKLLLIGVGYVAVITALAGPIAFVALAAPQLAQRVTGAAGVTLLPSALMGALLLVISDILARVILAPTQLAVGVVTSCLGGTYLLWLLVHQARSR